MDGFQVFEVYPLQLGLKLVKLLFLKQRFYVFEVYPLQLGLKHNPFVVLQTRYTRF